MRNHITRGATWAIATACTIACIAMLGFTGATVKAAPESNAHIATQVQVSPDGNPWGAPKL